MLTFICLVLFGFILLIATGWCIWQLLQQYVPSMKESAQDVFYQLKKFAEMLFGKDFLKHRPQRKPKKKEQEPIQDAEFKDVEPDSEAESAQPKNDTKNDKRDAEVKQTVEKSTSTDSAVKASELAKIAGSYERVELHLSSGVDYIEYYYFDDNDQPMEAAKATKCLIRECAADGTVLRELWGKPYKNQIYDHMRDIFKRN